MESSDKDCHMKLPRLPHQWSNFHCDLTLRSAFVGYCFILTRTLMRQEFIYNWEKACGRAGDTARHSSRGSLDQHQVPACQKWVEHTSAQLGALGFQKSPHISVMGVNGHYVIPMSHSARLCALCCFEFSNGVLLVLLPAQLLILTFPLAHTTVWKKKDIDLLPLRSIPNWGRETMANFPELLTSPKGSSCQIWPCLMLASGASFRSHPTIQGLIIFRPHCELDSSG